MVWLLGQLWIYVLAGVVVLGGGLHPGLYVLTGCVALGRLGGGLSPGLEWQVTEPYDDPREFPVPNDELSETSKTHLCYAQCLAKCIDHTQVRLVFFIDAAFQ